MALADHSPLDEVPDLPSWAGNITFALLLEGFIEESIYHASCMMPGSQWVNSKIGDPICSIRGAYRYVAGAQACLNNDFRGQPNLISQEYSAIVTLRLFKKPVPTAGKKTSDVFHETYSLLPPMLNRVLFLPRKKFGRKA